jgi:hypothetical protein
MTVYTFVAYIAISLHMTVVKRFGGVAAVVLATARKGMTLVLSFILFPKAFSWYYVLGAVLVLGGLLLSSLIKIHNKNKKVAGARELNKASEHERADIELGDDVELRKNLLGGTNGQPKPNTPISNSRHHENSHPPV